MADELRRAARLILASAYAAYSFGLHGPSDGPGKRYYRRVASPRLGDWVIEASAIGHAFEPETDRRYMDPLQAVGRVVAIEWQSRWYEPDEAGPHLVAIERDGFGCRPDYWSIQTLDGEVVRWGNCNMLAVPDRLRDWPGIWDDRD